MKRWLTGGIAVAAISVAAVSIRGTAAVAAPSAPGPAFGHHVADCARATGFGGEHNPGMHTGAAGWDGAACPG